jgi:hypothetical protein
MPPRKNDDLPGYQDVFTDGDLPREPRIMKDGTSVRWPAGWTLEHTMASRAQHRKPGGTAPEIQAGGKELARLRAVRVDLRDYVTHPRRLNFIGSFARRPRSAAAAREQPGPGSVAVTVADPARAVARLAVRVDCRS